jgi:pyruvate dehydrogenase E2 component (dihydrolipoamide acetyltransferase)
MRKLIAERMSFSARENAVIMMSRTVDVTRLMRIREEYRTEGERRAVRLPSINDMVLKATALALLKHPALNSTFENGMIRTYEDININMAVAIPEGGLMTPVIRNVDRQSLWEIGRLSREASDKTRQGLLTVEDMVGGSFTVTNVGKQQIEVATAIINPPQVAILAVGTVVPRLERVSGEIMDRLKMYLSLTVDHRIVDGYPAGLFLMTLTELLESPEGLWQ